MLEDSDLRSSKVLLPVFAIKISSTLTKSKTVNIVVLINPPLSMEDADVKAQAQVIKFTLDSLQAL